MGILFIGWWNGPECTNLEVMFLTPGGFYYQVESKLHFLKLNCEQMQTLKLINLWTIEFGIRYTYVQFRPGQHDGANFFFDYLSGQTTCKEECDVKSKSNISMGTWTARTALVQQGTEVNLLSRSGE